MRTRPVVASLAALSLTLPAAALAQRQSAIELGAFGRYTIQPDTLLVENVFAGGGRIGWYIFKNLSVEGEASFGVSNTKAPVLADSLKDISHTLWQGRLLYNTARGATNRWSALIGAGYVYDGFGRLRQTSPRGQGVSGLLGARYYITQRISARFEANGYYIFKDESQRPGGRPSTFTPSVQVGLSALFRNGGPTAVVPTVVVQHDTVRVQSPPDTVYRDRIANATGAGAAAGAGAGAGAGGGMAPGATVVIGAVNFDFDRAELSSDARRILDDVATSLARPEASSLTLIVTGNTDAIGGESYNNRLSERRAASVAEYLSSKGVANSRITQRAAGEGNPVASNANPEGRATNRRVLIELQNGPR